METTVVACIGLGGNVGDAKQAVVDAAGALDAVHGVRLTRLSRLYRTPAWGVLEQPDFINAAALVETSLPPRELLAALLALERRFGRVRAADGSDRWGPRTLDLDLLLYADQAIDEAGLQVPHPRLHERAFVLVPLAEIAPAMDIPGRGTVEQLLAGLEVTGIEAIG